MMGGVDDDDVEDRAADDLFAKMSIWDDGHR